MQIWRGILSGSSFDVEEAPEWRTDGMQVADPRPRVACKVFGMKMDCGMEDFLRTPKDLCMHYVGYSSWVYHAMNI